MQRKAEKRNYSAPEWVNVSRQTRNINAASKKPNKQTNKKRTKTNQPTYHRTKQTRTNPNKPEPGLEMLSLQPVSKAEAWQRAGRAGREQRGDCFRLYTEASFTALAETVVPEILRSNLANVALQLKALGIHDIAGLEFMVRARRRKRRKKMLLFCLFLFDDVCVCVSARASFATENGPMHHPPPTRCIINLFQRPSRSNPAQTTAPQFFFPLSVRVCRTLRPRRRCVAR